MLYCMGYQRRHPDIRPQLQQIHTIKQENELKSTADAIELLPPSPSFLRDLPNLLNLFIQACSSRAQQD